jgi:hypothetical protein
MSGGSRFEVDDPRFRNREETPRQSYAPPPPVPPAPRRSWLASCFMGCLFTLVVLALVAGIAAWWLWNNWRQVASDALSQAIMQSIDASDLPAQEKDEISAQVDRLAEAFRDGRVSAEQMGAIMQGLLESPLMTTLAASAIEKRYLAASHLDDDEQAAARQTLRRYLRAAIDGKISRRGMDAAMAHVADRQRDGGWRLRDRVSDDDLRAFLQEAKSQADDAGVADEPDDIDPSDEFKRIIDATLGEGP